MSDTQTKFDAVIVGGGFYGCAIAIYLASQKGMKNVAILERERKILQRASYSNQARVHNGYHYPRSFTTAYRSRINLPKFVETWPQSVFKSFTKLYAIARRNSKVTARQFIRFCDEIGAEIAPASQDHRMLFEKHLIEDVFEVKEYAFDTTKLAAWALDELTRYNIQILFETTAQSVSQCGRDLELCANGGGSELSILSPLVFNCTYSGLNQITGSFRGVNSGVKQEVTEMALVDMPKELKNIGVTVMDGPFFSAMPFPARGLHTLSHVRYTPHFYWVDQSGLNPYKRLHEYKKDSRVDRMIRDSARYLPLLSEAQYCDSLFEVKTILQKNEGDDGRPILFEKSPNLSGFYSVLGGKIDNIFDILERLDAEIIN